MQIIIILLAVFFIALLLIGAYDHSKRENAVHIPIESIAEYKNKTVFLEVEIVDLIEKKRHISTYVAGETVIPYFEYTFTYETAIPDVRVV